MYQMIAILSVVIGLPYGLYLMLNEANGKYRGKKPAENTVETTEENIS